MPVTKSAIKRVRRNKRREDVNAARVGRIRTFIKKVETAIAGGDKTAARAAFGVTKGVLHKNTASRKIARLNARIKSL
jgi:small subunit ribosomal protein S20